MSGSVYNPRLQPGGPAHPSAPLSAQGRLNDSLDSIRAEFDAVSQDLGLLRAQRDEFEKQVNGQVNEVNIIRQSLYELETQHQKIRTAYESEIGVLRQDLDVLRTELAQSQQGQAGPGGPPRSSVQSGPGGPPPHPMEGRQLDSRAGHEREREAGGPARLERMDSRGGLMDRERGERGDRDRDGRGMDNRSSLGNGPPPPLALPGSAGGPGLPGPGSAPGYPEQMYYSGGGAGRRGGDERDRERDMRERERERIERERAMDRERGREREMGRERERERDDRDLRERDPKRLKTDRMGTRAEHFSPQHPSKSNPTPSPHPHSQHPAHHSGPGAPPPGYPPHEAHSPTQPHNAVGGRDRERESGPSGSGSAGNNGGGGGGNGTVVLSSATPLFPEDMDVANTPPELKKEGSDWFALFNPKVKRTLDVSLVHELDHESVVCCVRFSADGKYLATGCNRTAQIFDTKTGAITCELKDESAAKTGDLYIRSVCFSPDGRLLATGAEDKTIRIWDIAKKRIVNVFDGHTQEIYSLDFSRDGRLIASGSGDRTARIWDVENNSCKVLTIDEPDQVDSGVTSVAISPTGALLAAGSLDTVVRIWDVQTGHLVERLRGHTDSVYSVKFTPDGRGLVSGSLDKTLKYWDVRPLLSPAARQPLGPPDRRAIATEGGEKGCKCTMNFNGHKDFVLSVAVSHDGQWVVSGSKDRGVHFWDARTAQPQLVLQGHKNSVISIDLSPTGTVLATGSGDSQARLWSYTAQ